MDYSCYTITVVLFHTKECVCNMYVLGLISNIYYLIYTYVNIICLTYLCFENTKTVTFIFVRIIVAKCFSRPISLAFVLVRMSVAICQNFDRQIQ